MRYSEVAREIIFHASMFTEYNPQTDDAFRKIVALAKELVEESK